MNDQNYNYFKDNFSELIERYNGKFIVIKNATVIAEYSSFEEAYQVTIKTEDLGTFLIQQCVRRENDSAHFAWHNVSFGEVVQA